MISPIARGAGVEFQLALLMDGSSSIRSGDFNLERAGIADAIRAIVPTDGTVELTVVQFGLGVNGEARVEIAPTVIDSVEARDQFAQRVQKIRQALGRTNMEVAIDLAMKQLKNSPHPLATKHKRAINIATDGKPNRPIGEKTGREHALQARDRAVAQGLDRFDAEAIGQAVTSSDPTTLIGFLLALAYPQPSVLIEDPKNPPDTKNNGFVIKVENFAALEKAFELKLKTILEPISADAGGPYFCQSKQRIRLDGSKSKASDEGQITSFVWDFNSDGKFDDGSGVNPTFDCPDVDTTVTLQVTDNRGKSATGTTKVIIGFPPVANPGGPYVCKEKRTVTLDGSGSSDKDGTVVKFEWDFDGDGKPDATGASVSFTCPAVDKLSAIKVTLTVTDNDGLRNSKFVNVEITPNLAPVADAGPATNGNPSDVAYTCDPGQTIQLDGSGSFDPDGHIVSYEWEFKGGNNFKDATGSTASFVCPNVSGLAVDGLIKLRVTDDDGAQTVDNALLVVTRSCPQEGKLNDFFQTLKGLGIDYQRYLLEMLNTLASVASDIDSASVDPSDEDLSNVEDTITKHYPVIGLVEDNFHLILALSTDLQCRVNAFKKNLQDRVDSGKLSSVFGKRILRDLDALLDIFAGVDKQASVAIGKVDGADAALNNALAAIADQEPEGVIDALAAALKQLNGAIADLSRIQRKFINEMFKRLDSVQRVLGIAIRKGGVSSAGVAVLGEHIQSDALGRAVFVAEGTSVAKIEVQVFTLFGAQVFAQSHAGNQLVFNGRSLNGQWLANGVYLYVITTTDAQGKVLRSEVNKLVITR